MTRESREGGQEGAVPEAVRQVVRGGADRRVMLSALGWMAGSTGSSVLRAKAGDRRP